MERLTKINPKVLNSIFAVTKPDASQKLIIDARIANQVFVDPSKVDLPNAGLLAELSRKKICRLIVDKSDDNFYHELKLTD